VAKPYWLVANFNFTDFRLLNTHGFQFYKNKILLDEREVQNAFLSRKI
jgi:hypothetical protein